MLKLLVYYFSVGDMEMAGGHNFEEVDLPDYMHPESPAMIRGIFTPLPSFANECGRSRIMATTAARRRRHTVDRHRVPKRFAGETACENHTNKNNKDNANQLDIHLALAKATAENGR